MNDTGGAGIAGHQRKAPADGRFPDETDVMGGRGARTRDLQWHWGQAHKPASGAMPGKRAPDDADIDAGRDAVLQA
jgi:hypothetical protein